MKENNMDAEKCKLAWQNATNDTERFAALFVVIKYLKAAETTDDERREMFQTIGFSFLKRLLYSDVPPGCPPNILKAVSMSILACFCSHPEIAADDKLHVFIPSINDILLENTASTTVEDEPMVLDAISCLTSIAKYGKCIMLLFDKGVFTTLVNLYSSRVCGHPQVLTLIMHMVVQTNLTLSEENYNVLKNLMDILANQFCIDQSEKKFELCEQILYILLMHPTFQASNDATSNIREALKDILQSKIGKEQRDNAIKLAGLMVVKFGSQWFIDNEETSRPFFIVLVQIICIEVRMILDDHSAFNIAGNAFLLTACYKILECVISTMISENWFQSNRQFVERLLDSLKMAMLSVINFVKSTSALCKKISFISTDKLKSDKVNAEQILLATIRMLCSWLAEETFALQDDVREILPFVILVSEQWFNETDAVEAELDPLRFLMSPLCHLSADDSSRAVLLECNIVSLLLKYMDHHWKQFEKEKSTDSEGVLTTICGILLNIVVLESQLVIENDEFFSLLKHLFVALPALTSSMQHLVLKANYSALGLLIAKHYHKKVKSCETSFYRFLSASIKFLWDAHHVEEENGELRIVETRQYHEVWNDIDELWFLGMQALSTLLTPIPWIASFVAESGWPIIIIQELAAVSPNKIEGNVKHMYQTLLCPLARLSKDVSTSLAVHNADTVCLKHGLHELLEILSSSSN